MAPLSQLLRSRVVAPVTVLLVLGGASASAQDRCEGTFCDLYYNHVAPAPGAQTQSRQPAPTATQPAQPGDGVLARLFSGGAPPQQQAPDGASPAKKPLVAVQGGGVVGLMQGRAPERCTGTLCDFYYGGPPKEEPAAAEPAAAPAQGSAARAADAEIDEPALVGRGIEPRESVPRCTANSRDPWACYR